MGLTIHAGVCKGMKLVSPRGEATRPTRAITRDAIMNSLQGVIPGASFLDLFAGTGAVGLEALSRGAIAATFAELQGPALKALATNINELQRRYTRQGLDPPIVNVEPGDVLDTLRRVTRRPSLPQFDLIWADPPYANAQSIVSEILDRLAIICQPGGQIIVESGDDLTNNVALPADWQWRDVRPYGRTVIHRLQRKER